MAYTKNYSKTTRTLVGNYKGYPIFKEVTKYFKHSVFNLMYYDTHLVSQVTMYYCLGTKGGNINKSSDRYASCCTSVESIKSLADDIESGKRIVLTEKEKYDWVLAPNSKNGWGFNTEMLLTIMREYKKANPRRRVGYLDRLEDANFHSECAALDAEDYAEFERLAKMLK